MLHKSRAYSVLTAKNFDEDDDFITIEGVASTPAPDRYGDVVVPTGAKFQTPMPLLWQHDHRAPVGQVIFAEPNETGIPFTAKIPKVKESGKVKERVDEAIHSLKYGLIAAVSIGFQAQADDVEFLDEGGIKFNVWEWLELSLVTIPAQAEAILTSIKSFDVGLKSASASKPNNIPARVRAKRTVPTGPFNFTNDPDKGNES